MSNILIYIYLLLYFLQTLLSLLHCTASGILFFYNNGRQLILLHKKKGSKLNQTFSKKDYDEKIG